MAIFLLCGLHHLSLCTKNSVLVYIEAKDPGHLNYRSLHEVFLRLSVCFVLLSLPVLVVVVLSECHLYN